MKIYSIDEKVLGNIINYLCTKPFQEVAQIITTLQNVVQQGPQQPIAEKDSQQAMKGGNKK